MHFAFCIHRIFPHGGLARTFLKIVRACLERGHQVRVYAMRVEMAIEGAEIVHLPVRGLTNHRQHERFVAEVFAHLERNPADLVVGINKMPGLDVYYAGDTCFMDKVKTSRPFAYQLTPRYKHYVEYERAVFSPRSRTRILYIAPRQVEVYHRYYQTPKYRFYRLPPGIDPVRDEPSPERATAARREIVGDHRMVLFVGSGFRKKGLDRALRGMASLPGDVDLVIVGSDKERVYRRLAEHLGIADRVHFLGGRNDVPLLMKAADAMVHPALDETAGKVILEAMLAGLPILVTSVCGYADYVGRAGAGIVFEEPFEQARFNAELKRLLTSPEREWWRRSGPAFARAEDLHGLAEVAADRLEEFARGIDRSVITMIVYRYDHTDPRYRTLVPLGRTLRERGYHVQVFAYSWLGPTPPEFEIKMVPVAGMSEKVRIKRFVGWVETILEQAPTDFVIGFESTSDHAPPHLAETESTTPSDALEPELKALRESGCIDAWVDDAASPQGLVDSVPVSSFDLRGHVGAADSEFVILLAGGDLEARGIRRILQAMNRLPEDLRSRLRLVAVGQASTDIASAIGTLGLGNRVWIGNLEVAEAIAAADLLVDASPIRGSNGWVFDALRHGVPALVVDAIREADLVRASGGGIVVDHAPFEQAAFDQALRYMLENHSDRKAFAQRGARHCNAPEHLGRIPRFIHAMEQHLEQDKHSRAGTLMEQGRGIGAHKKAMGQ